MRETTRFVLLAMLVLAATGCATVGPASISNGRSTYNAVINRTEDEQILSMIVRQRYDETFGMLAVASVTASLRLSASAGVNAGVGPRSGYVGNLVPLSAGVAYEENPTISYVPLRGEQFTERMLAPITAEQALLLGRMSTDQVEVLRLVVRRANGLANPLYSWRRATGEFDRFMDRFAQLRGKGKLDIVRSGDGTLELLLHDHTEEEARDAVEMLRMVGVDGERGAPVLSRSASSWARPARTGLISKPRRLSRSLGRRRRALRFPTHTSPKGSPGLPWEGHLTNSSSFVRLSLVRRTLRWPCCIEGGGSLWTDATPGASRCS